MNIYYNRNMKEHSNLYWWFFDRIPGPVYRAWRWLIEKPKEMKANKLRKKGIVPAEDAWNSDLTICDQLAQHLEWHLKWLGEQYEVFGESEKDARYKSEMERALKGLRSYAKLKYQAKPTSKRSMRELQWSIHWVGKNVWRLWW